MQSTPERVLSYTSSATAVYPWYADGQSPTLQANMVTRIGAGFDTNAGSRELANRLELARAVAPMLATNPDALHIALDGQAIA